MVIATGRQRNCDKSLHTKQPSSGYVPKGRFDESPNTIEVPACSHELESTSKASQAESVSAPSETIGNWETNAMSPIKSVL